MIYVQELWFPSSKVKLYLFTIHLYTKLQIGNHNFELSPSTWRSVVSGWDHSDFISSSLDIKSSCMFHLLNNLPISNYFHSYFVMPLSTEKIEEILLEYHHFMCELESSHMRASIVSALPYIRPRANRRRFALILKTLVDDSETSETLNPTEILHSI